MNTEKHRNISKKDSDELSRNTLKEFRKLIIEDCFGIKFSIFKIHFSHLISFCQ